MVLLRGREELLPLCQGMPRGLGSSFAATAVRLAAVAPAFWRAASHLNQGEITKTGRLERGCDTAISASIATAMKHVLFVSVSKQE